MKSEIPHELIEKYLRQACTPEEEMALYDWYDSLASGEGLDGIMPPSSQQALKERMRNRIGANIADAETRSGKRRAVIRRLTYSLSGAAAMLVLVFGLQFLLRKTPEKLESGIRGEITVSNTTTGMHKQLLPDSSVVWLSPNSQLEYSQQFSGDKRQVRLTGEAFFQVREDARRPFIIYSNGIVTKVLGTSFRIRSFEKTSTEVAVATGKVSVAIEGNKRSEMILLPDQHVTYEPGDQRLARDSSAAASMAIWKKAGLSFTNTPVSEVIKKLNRQFGVQITLKDKSTENYSLNADFTDQNLPDILEMMQTSLNITYELEGDQIIFSKK
ncbi:FecR family protein [Chitinophaga sp. GCM10012297]|uniref:FecR domain-containing protein n=1 Tax=Chitinophaga chungangae TaxID=2821488 RepID=A0ABS3YFM7_9BACT|nr:FecR domain-containing protein [Chitinophaga chungangae]MBO9153480.1 FecR domain-containing protein [Chitinophaga chungangae]